MSLSQCLAMIALVALFLIIAAIGYLYFFTRSPPCKETYSTTEREQLFLNYDSLFQQVQTGDVLLLSGKTFGETTIKMGSGSPYSHVALVVVDESHLENHTDEVVNGGTARRQVYLWESDVGQSYMDGVRVITLYDKLTRYKGYPTGVWLRLKDEHRYVHPRSDVDTRSTVDDVYSSDHREPLKTAHFIPIVKKYIHVEFPSCMEYYYVSGYPNSWLYKYFHDYAKRPRGDDVPRPADHEITSTSSHDREVTSTSSREVMYCSELVAQTLQDLGILSTTRIASYYSPGSFLDVNSEVGNLYESPRLFDFKDLREKARKEAAIKKLLA